MSSNKTDNQQFHSLGRKPETMHFRALATGNKRPWTEDEQRYLLEHHKEMFIEDIAEALDRTVSATKGKAAHMGCSIKSKPKGNT